MTALQAAVYKQNAVLVRTLLMAGADIDAQGCPDTPLQIAVDTNNAQIVRILLESGADIGDVREYRVAPLQMASAINNAEIVGYLSEYDADVDHPPIITTRKQLYKQPRELAITHQCNRS